jgi:hypothetical protein
MAEVRKTVSAVHGTKSTRKEPGTFSTQKEAGT